MSLEVKLDRVVQRHKELEKLLSEADMTDSEVYAKVSKEYSDLTPIVETINSLRSLREESSDLELLMEDSETDEEMRAMAETEHKELKLNEPELEQELQIMLIPKDAADARDSIIEIRAGTGGDEAGLFAADLFRMYQRYAELKSWKVEVMSASSTGIGGYKEIIASITGKNVFSKLKFESGVHRVQRVPETESSGRIHTSAATVAVLPEVEDVDIEINDNDLRIDTYRASGPGGQSVNTTDSAVRITHLPTNIAVQ